MIASGAIFVAATGSALTLKFGFLEPPHERPPIAAGVAARTIRRSVRKVAYLYEHMFDSSRTSPLVRRARAAFSLARSFLLLEDDYDVNWEVDQAEHSRGEQRAVYIEASAASHRAPRRPGAAAHPHRTSLRRGAVVRSGRRAGQPVPGPQLCLCAATGAADARAHSHERRPVVTGGTRSLAPDRGGTSRANAPCR